MDEEGPPNLIKLKRRRNQSNHKLEMMGIRKNMCSSEIREIDNKIANLNSMRKIVLDRLASLEQEELDLEQELLGVDNRLDDLQEELEDEAALAANKTPLTPTTNAEEDTSPPPPDFMSKSIFDKLNTKPANKVRAQISSLDARFMPPLLTTRVRSALTAAQRIQHGLRCHLLSICVSTALPTIEILVCTSPSSAQPISIVCSMFHASEPSTHTN